MKSNRKLSVSFFFLLMVVSVLGCNNAFEPLEENDDLHFTMFGVFDLSADTQWVRVMPVMDSLVSRSQSPIDAEVRLIRKSTGETVILNDSLFKYRDEFYAWNFWTTESLNEGEEYMIEAESSDARISRAEVSIPLDFPTPLAEYDPERIYGKVYGSGVERMVVADAIYKVRLSTDEGVLETEVYIPHAEEVDYFEDGSFSFEINDIRRIVEYLSSTARNVDIISGEALIISGDEHWPDFSDYTEEQYVLPNIQSNVENGLGVVSGVVSKRIPLESCYDQQGELIACPLIFPPY